MKQEKIRKVFLDELPHKGKYIDWEKSVGMSFGFKYDGIKGEIHIVEYFKLDSKVKLKYNKMEKTTHTGNVTGCRLTFILGIKVKEYKYNIGDTINFTTGDIIITKQLRNNKGKRYEYKCSNCGQTTEIQEEKLSDTHNCPVCCSNPQVLVKGINDIATTNPWIIDFLKDKEDAYRYTKGSDKKIWFKCPNCGYERKMKLYQFTTYGLSCPTCGDGFSMGNKIMLNVLLQLGIDFENEKRFDWCRYKLNNKEKRGVYDFYIPFKKLIIEMDGKQHNKEGNIFKISLQEQQHIDKQKDNLAKIHDIEVIRIDCMYTDLKYIKNNILNSKLKYIFNMNDIDWHKIFSNSMTSKTKEACNIFNSREITVSELASMFKTNVTTIRHWLHLGNELNWCNYNGKEEMRKSSQRLNGANSKIISIFKDGALLQTFPSGSELERKSEEMFGVKLIISGISQVCNGKKSQYKGFTFKYIND